MKEIRRQEGFVGTKKKREKVLVSFVAWRRERKEEADTFVEATLGFLFLRCPFVITSTPFKFKVANAYCNHLMFFYGMKNHILVDVYDPSPFLKHDLHGVKDTSFLSTMS